MGELAKRKKIIELCKQMNATGLNQGTSGNISVIHNDQMLITPSGIPYDQMQPDQIAQMPLDRDDDHWEGPCKPSSEWHFHRAILNSHPSYQAVVHTHSTYATVLSIARKYIPPCHYMIAAFGGEDVRCSDYATFGTEALSAAILDAMRERNACLIANHGMVTAGANLEKAMWLAVELETLSHQYYAASQMDSMVLLDKDEIHRVREKFKTYGLQENKKK